MPTAPHRLSNPLRVASPPLRPWPNLPAETQAQVARLLADLLRRLTQRHQATENARAERRDGR
jgi:hypothetical protein